MTRKLYPRKFAKSICSNHVPDLIVRNGKVDIRCPNCGTATGHSTPVDLPPPAESQRRPQKRS